EKIEYLHKKQTGGSGQFARVIVNVEPLPMDSNESEIFEFDDQITGGRIPREYIPSVKAGAEDAMPDGVLAGYPLVGVKLELTDGQYHEVDSSEMAFKIAGRMVLKEAAKRAKPVLLEPMMAVEVICPEESMGDVIGDINSRRGMVQEMGERGNDRTVKAQVDRQSTRLNSSHEKISYAVFCLKKK